MLHLEPFSSRIKAVYAFGLATEQQYKDMEILRKIRNSFAHDWGGGFSPKGTTLLPLLVSCLATHLRVKQRCAVEKPYYYHLFQIAV